MTKKEHTLQEMLDMYVAGKVSYACFQLWMLSKRKKAVIMAYELGWEDCENATLA